MEIESNRLWKKSMVRYCPILLYFLYNLVIIMLFSFGPISWNYQGGNLFWFYMFAYPLMCISGFMLTVHTLSKMQHKLFKPKNAHLSVANTTVLLWVFLGVCFCMQMIKCKNITVSDSFFSFDFLKELISALKNPGEAYNYHQLKMKNTPISNTRFFTLISFVFSFATWSLVPVFIFRWPKINFIQKSIFILICVWEVTAYVSIGTNKGIFDQLFLFATSLVLCFIMKWSTEKKQAILDRSFCLVFTLFLLFFSFWFYSRTMDSRLEFAHPKDDISTSNGESLSGVNFSFESMKDFGNVVSYWGDDELTTPDSKRTFVLMLTSYLTQGYYGFSLGLDDPFMTTYGLGHSSFLIRQVDNQLDLDLWSKTYMYRNHSTWHSTGKWHTMYLWWANDFSFIGVLLVMFLIGSYCALCWYYAIVHNDIISQCLLTLFVIIFLYAPANNQVFSQALTMFAFWELTALWFIKNYLSKYIKISRDIV